MLIFLVWRTTAIVISPQTKVENATMFVIVFMLSEFSCYRSSPFFLRADVAVAAAVVVGLCNVGGCCRNCRLFPSMVRSVGRWARLCMAYALGSLFLFLPSSLSSPRFIFLHMDCFNKTTPPPPPFAPSDARGSVPLFAREDVLAGQPVCVCRYLMIISPKPPSRSYIA
jgi:hypothetical protein